jgi:hypothetical protein
MSEKKIKSAIALLVLIATLVAGAYFLVKEHIKEFNTFTQINWLYNHGEIEQGYIASVHRTREGSGGRRSSTAFKYYEYKGFFELNDEEYIFVSNIRTLAQGFDQSTQVLITYDPDNPSIAEIYDKKFRTAGYLYRYSYILIADGMLLAMIVLVTAILMHLKREKAI